MKIVDLTVQNFSHPMGPFHQRRFKGPEEISFLTIKTSDGVEGYATARAQGGTSGMAIGEYIVKTAKPLIIGENPLDRERIWQTLFKLERGMYAPIFVTSVIDVALWDIAGKVMGQPVYRVLGGYRDRIMAYATSSDYDTIDEYIADALRCFQRGYRAYKIHPFYDPDRDIELCETLRQEFGPDVVLMLDSLCSYNRRDALRVGRAIERLGFHWYEEPLSHYDYEGNKELRLALDIPIVGAETTSGSAYSGATYISQGAFDMILCDVYWKMGITGMMKLARTCEAMQMDIANHHAGSSIMNFANLHCLCATPNVDFFEILVPTQQYDCGLKSYANIDKDGYVAVPQTPGLGVDVDWDYIDNHTTSRL